MGACLSTKWPHIKLMIRIFLSWVAGVMCGGPSSSFAIVSELYIDNGIFYSTDECQHLPIGSCPPQNTTLQALYYTTICVSVILLYFVGHFQDAFGGRTTGALGGILCASFYALHALAITWAPPLLFLALPLSAAAGYMTHMSTMSFIFHAGPQNVALLLGIVHSSGQVAGMGSNVLQLLVLRGLPLQLGVLLFSSAGILAAIIAYVSNANANEFQDAAEKATGIRPSSVSFSPFHMLREIWGSMKVHQTHSTIFLVCVAASYTFLLNFASVHYQWYLLMVGESDAISLNYWATILSALCGLILSPLCGFFFDRFGILSFLLYHAALLVLTLATFWPPIYWIQLFNRFIFNAWFSSLLTLLTQWCVIFASHSLTTGMYGFLLGLSGIIQLVINNVITVVINEVTDGYSVYVVPFISLGTIALATIICLFLFLRLHPPPVPALPESGIKNSA